MPPEPTNRPGLAMNRRTASLWQRLLVALLIVAGASAFRAVFFGGLGRGIPYLLYYPATMLAALYGGLAAGFLATILSACLCFFWIQQGSLSLVETLAFSVFFIGCTMISFVCEAMRRAQARAKRAQDEIEAAIQQLRSEVVERKQAEAALRTSETQLRVTLESTADGILAVDNKGKVLKANRRFADLWRIPQSLLESHDDEALLAFVLNQLSEPEAFQAKVQALYKSDASDMDLITFKDGRIFERYSNTMLMDGIVTGRVWSFRDITERKQAEEALRESEEKFRALFEKAEDGILLLSSQGEVVAVNASFASLHGYSVEEVLKLNLKDLDLPESAQRTPERLQRVLAGQPMVFEVEHYCKNGQTIPLEVSANRVAFGGEQFILAFHRDITDRKQAEKKLWETNEYLENLFNHANAPIIVWDPQLRITRFNHAFESLTGRPAGEVIGKSLDLLFPPALVESSMALIKKTTGGDRWETVEIAILHLDGSVRTVLWNSATVCAADGKTPVAAIAQGQDITERKQAEANIARTLADLERSNKELEQFAYVASHDLQEPLRMVSSYTQLLAQRYESQLDDKAKKYIHYAVDGAIRMQSLIDDLLAYSRTGTRGKPLQATDSHAVLGEAIRNLTAIIQENRAIITNDDLPTVRADPSQLVLVFQNLLANAIKFHRQEIPRVHVSALEQGRQWLFTVKDNGIGIEPQHAERVFLIFQRLHTREEYPGTGIGLAVCKRIVERHGGKIWFESQPGNGSTFFFTVPK